MNMKNNVQATTAITTMFRPALMSRSRLKAYKRLVLVSSRKDSSRKDFRIGTLRYNWPMSAHVSQAFSTSTVPIRKIYIHPCWWSQHFGFRLGFRRRPSRSHLMPMPVCKQTNLRFRWKTADVNMVIFYKQVPYSQQYLFNAVII